MVGATRDIRTDARALPPSVPLLMRAVLQFRGASSAVIFIPPRPSVIRGDALLKEILRAEIRERNILRVKSARSVHMQMIFQPQGDHHSSPLGDSSQT